jgi:hypothetical protein
MAHSLVDYPLRTSAMMVILAFSCALLIDPPAGEQPRGLENRRNSKVIDDAAAPRSIPTGPAVMLPNLVKEKPQPQTIDWPEEWLDPGSSR